MAHAPATILETERVILRPLTPDDLNNLFTFYSDPAVIQFIPDAPRTVAETQEELNWIIDVYYQQYGFGLWATLEKKSGAFMGRCGLIPWTIDQRQEVEVAYALAQSYWGQGYATEIARAIAHYGLVHLGLPRLISLIDPDHSASRRVAEKVGMTLEQELEGIDGDGIPTLIYAISP